jgi:hypothetical protein
MPMRGILDSALLPHVIHVVASLTHFRPISLSHTLPHTLPHSNLSAHVQHNPKTIHAAHLTNMEALLRQSKSMCPFLHKTSPATLRSLSTTTAAARQEVSPSAGSMSNLQVLARRCPIMGKALAVQNSRNGNNALAGAFGGVRAYHTRVNRARLHTTASKEAQAVDLESLRGKQGTQLPRSQDAASLV